MTDVTLAQFRVAFPEFKTAGDPLVETKLAAAKACLSEEILGALYPEAVMVKTADMLAKSPAGQSARMVNKDGTTTYSVRFNEIKWSVASGVSVS